MNKSKFFEIILMVLLYLVLIEATHYNHEESAEGEEPADPDETAPKSEEVRQIEASLESYFFPGQTPNNKQFDELLTKINKLGEAGIRDVKSYISSLIDRYGSRNWPIKLLLHLHKTSAVTVSDMIRLIKCIRELKFSTEFDAELNKNFEEFMEKKEGIKELSGNEVEEIFSELKEMISNFENFSFEILSSFPLQYVDYAFRILLRLLHRVPEHHEMKAIVRMTMILDAFIKYWATEKNLSHFKPIADERNDFFKKHTELREGIETDSKLTMTKYVTLLETSDAALRTEGKKLDAFLHEYAEHWEGVTRTHFCGNIWPNFGSLSKKLIDADIDICIQIGKTNKEKIIKKLQACSHSLFYKLGDKEIKHHFRQAIGPRALEVEKHLQTASKIDSRDDYDFLCNVFIATNYRNVEEFIVEMIHLRMEKTLNPEWHTEETNALEKETRTTFNAILDKQFHKSILEKQAKSMLSDRLNLIQSRDLMIKLLRIIVKMELDERLGESLLDSVDTLNKNEVENFEEIYKVYKTTEGGMKEDHAMDAAHRSFLRVYKPSDETEKAILRGKPLRQMKDTLRQLVVHNENVSETKIKELLEGINKFGKPEIRKVKNFMNKLIRNYTIENWMIRLLLESNTISGETVFDLISLMKSILNLDHFTKFDEELSVSIGELLKKPEANEELSGDEFEEISSELEYMVSFVENRKFSVNSDYPLEYAEYAFRILLKLLKRVTEQNNMEEIFSNIMIMDAFIELWAKEKHSHHFKPVTHERDEFFGIGRHSEAKRKFEEESETAMTDFLEILRISEAKLKTEGEELDKFLLNYGNQWNAVTRTHFCGKISQQFEGMSSSLIDADINIRVRIYRMFTQHALAIKKQLEECSQSVFYIIGEKAIQGHFRTAIMPRSMTVERHFETDVEKDPKLDSDYDFLFNLLMVNDLGNIDELIVELIHLEKEKTLNSIWETDEDMDSVEKSNKMLFRYGLRNRSYFLYLESSRITHADAKEILSKMKPIRSRNEMIGLFRIVVEMKIEDASGVSTLDSEVTLEKNDVKNFKEMYKAYKTTEEGMKEDHAMDAAHRSFLRVCEPSDVAKNTILRAKTQRNIKNTLERLVWDNVDVSEERIKELHFEINELNEVVIQKIKKFMSTFDDSRSYAIKDWLIKLMIDLNPISAVTAFDMIFLVKLICKLERSTEFDKKLNESIKNTMKRFEEQKEPPKIDSENILSALKFMVKCVRHGNFDGNFPLQYVEYAFRILLKLLIRKPRISHNREEEIVRNAMIMNAFIRHWVKERRPPHFESITVERTGFFKMHSELEVIIKEKSNRSMTEYLEILKASEEKLKIEGEQPNKFLQDYANHWEGVTKTYFCGETFSVFEKMQAHTINSDINIRIHIDEAQDHHGIKIKDQLNSCSRSLFHRLNDKAIKQHFRKVVMPRAINIETHIQEAGKKSDPRLELEYRDLYRDLCIIFIATDYRHLEEFIIEMSHLNMEIRELTKSEEEIRERFNKILVKTEFNYNIENMNSRNAKTILSALHSGTEEEKKNIKDELSQDRNKLIKLLHTLVEMKLYRLLKNSKQKGLEEEKIASLEHFYGEQKEEMEKRQEVDHAMEAAHRSFARVFKISTSQQTTPQE